MHVTWALPITALHTGPRRVHEAVLQTAHGASQPIPARTAQTAPPEPGHINQVSHLETDVPSCTRRRSVQVYPGTGTRCTPAPAPGVPRHRHRVYPGTGTGTGTRCTPAPAPNSYTRNRVSMMLGCPTQARLQRLLTQHAIPSAGIEGSGAAGFWRTATVNPCMVGLLHGMLPRPLSLEGRIHHTHHSSTSTQQRKQGVAVNGGHRLSGAASTPASSAPHPEPLHRS